MSKPFNWSTLLKYRIYFIQAFLVFFLMYLLLNEQEINTLKITLILITSLSFLKSAQGKKR